MSLEVSPTELHATASAEDFPLHCGTFPARRPAPELLTVSPGTGHLVEIMHAATLCRDGVRNQRGELHAQIANYFEELRELKINTLYLVGVWRSSEFSALIMPHFARNWPRQPDNPAHVGPSVFAVDAYAPMPGIGTWQELRFLAEQARERGIDLMIDFIPNTIGLDSEITRHSPHFISDADVAPLQLHEFERSAARHAPLYVREKNEQQVRHRAAVHPAPGGGELIIFTRDELDSGTTYTFYLERDAEKKFQAHFWMKIQSESGEQLFCKELGRDAGSGAVWADVARLKTWDGAVRRWHADLLGQLGACVPLLRADMSHLPGNGYWQEVLSLAAQAQHPAIWGEAYGFGKHSELAQLGIKSYANWLREWLRDGDIAQLMRHLYQDPAAQQFLRKYAIAYSANHDDDRGPHNLIEGAISAIITALPVSSVMFAQGQRYGDERRYGADQHVPWTDYAANVSAAAARDPEYVHFMQSLMRIAAADVMRSPLSACRPAQLRVPGEKDSSKVFHTVRELGAERVLVVVDFQREHEGALIEVDVAQSFGLSAEALRDFMLVNLIDGRTSPAEATLQLRPQGRDIGHNSFFYALLKHAGCPASA